MSRHAQRGSVLAEFAIASVAALTLMFGILEFARAMYMYDLVTAVSRDGARFAMLNGATSCPGGTPSPDPLQSFVSSRAPLAGPGALQVTTTCTTSTACATSSSTNCSNAGACTSSAAPYNTKGCIISVQVAYSFNFIVPLVSRVALPMSSSSTMVISR
jgi:Flp pilus assembly protein TadG